MSSYLKYASLFIAVLLGVSFGAPATAQGIDCDAGNADYLLCNYAQGSVRTDGRLDSSTETGKRGDGTGFYNSYFLYDTEDLNGVELPEGTQLTVTFFATGLYDTNGNTLPDTNETLTLYDITEGSVNALEAALVGSLNTVSESVHIDLETGGPLTGDPLAGDPNNSYGTYNFNPSELPGGNIGTFTVNLSSTALADLNDAIEDGRTFGIGAYFGSADRTIELVDISVNAPGSGIQAVPEVSATGALAAFGSLLAMMAFLWERRRISLTAA